MHLSPLKLPLKTLEIMWKFPWKKVKGWNSRLKTLETNVGVAIEESLRVNIRGWKLHHILSIRGQTLNLYLSTMKIKGNSGVIWPLKKFRGYNSRSKSISEEKETVNLHFSTMKKKLRGYSGFVPNLTFEKNIQGLEFKDETKHFILTLLKFKGERNPRIF